MTARACLMVSTQHADENRDSFWGRTSMLNGIYDVDTSACVLLFTQQQNWSQEDMDNFTHKTVWPDSYATMMKTLSLISLVLGLAALGALALAVVTDYWLFSVEPITPDMFPSEGEEGVDPDKLKVREWRIYARKACEKESRPFHTKRQKRFGRQPMLSVRTYVFLLPMDDSDNITLARRYTDADVGKHRNLLDFPHRSLPQDWCEWALTRLLSSLCWRESIT